MKKSLLFVAVVLFSGAVQGQNLLTENFDNVAGLGTLGWSQTNQSTPAGTNTWAQATATIQPYFIGGAYNGDVNSFIYASFNSTTGGTGTISNWLITPVVTLENGDVISFYSKKGLSGGATIYADRLEMRISTNGAATVNPTGGSAGLGDFTTLALTINPTQGNAPTDYPSTWTQYSYTVSGLTGPTDSKVAFRYFVTLAGPSGTNSDQIAIDAVSIDRTLNTSSFFKNNFAMYPNPASDVLNISTNGVAITAATITDINGRVVGQQSFNDMDVASINVGSLNAGVYFISVESAEGKGTAKFVKN